MPQAFFHGDKIRKANLVSVGNLCIPRGNSWQELLQQKIFYDRVGTSKGQEAKGSLPKCARREEYMMIRVKDLKKKFGEREEHFFAKLFSVMIVFSFLPMLSIICYTVCSSL